MKVGALILGIIGGLIALTIGYLGFSLGSLANAGQPSGAGTVLQLVSVGIPVIALIGAGVVMSKPALGALLMGLSAFGLVFVLGFNFFSMIPVVLLVIAAILGFSASNETPKNTSSTT